MLGRRTAPVVIGAVLTFACAVPARASDSTVTFTTTGGNLSIASASSASLTGGNPVPGGTVTGTLGTVTVTDGRGTAAGWAAGVYSTTGFTAAGNPTITNASIVYTPGAPTGATVPGSPTIIVGTAGSPGPDAGAARTVYVYSNATAGGNTVSWNPTLAIAIPDDAQPGAVYSGTISYRVA